VRKKREGKDGWDVGKWRAEIEIYFFTNKKPKKKNREEKRRAQIDGLSRMLAGNLPKQKGEGDGS